MASTELELYSTYEGQQDIIFKLWMQAIYGKVMGFDPLRSAGVKNMPKWGNELTKIFELLLSQSTDQITAHFLGVKCSIFQALSSAIKLMYLNGVCKARDHQNLGAVFHLIRAAATFCGCCSPASDDINNAKQKNRTWSTGN